MMQCPECNAHLAIATKLELWDRVYCNACGVELEIVNEYPFELEVVFDFDDALDVDDLNDTLDEEEWEREKYSGDVDEEADENWEGDLDEDW